MTAEAYAVLERLAQEHEQLAADIRALVVRSRALTAAAPTAPAGEVSISEAVRTALRDGSRTTPEIVDRVAAMRASASLRTRTENLDRLVSATISRLVLAGDVAPASGSGRRGDPTVWALTER